MSGSERRRLFLPAALAIAAALAGLALVDHDVPGQKRSTKATPGRVVAPADPMEVRRPEPSRRALRDGTPGRRAAREDLPRSAHRSLGSRRAAARVVRTARAFVSALLRWESGAGGRGTRAAVEATAEPRLAGLVLSERPRLPPGGRRVPAGRLAGVELVRLGPHIAEAQATVERAGRRTGRLVVLRRNGGGWRAGALR